MKLPTGFDLPMITSDMARELAIAQHVCIRPVMRRVEDRQTGTEDLVAIPCGSTRETVCPPCAHKARVLRIQQCAEGWHRIEEPDKDDRVHDIGEDEDRDLDERDLEDQDNAHAEVGSCGQYDGDSSRRVRSTRRRQDAPDLPKVPVEDRTVGRVFTAPDGREYRPSMFLTVTLPSYGPVRPWSGVPVDPESYDYRRAALDALHFAKLVDRFVQNLRRCAGYKVQYFAAVEPQKRLAPHLHAALRGAIHRAILKTVVQATYLQLWWPRFDQAVYVDRLPIWDGTGYCDPDTGEVLPTWKQARGQASGEPAHVLRFGAQLDMAGIIAPSEDADRAVRYLTKYLTKSIADAHTDPDDSDPAYQRHVDRLHTELRWLLCTPRCANWLRYGIQPHRPVPGLQPGHCDGPARERENLGLGGRRVLVSRQWSGKTIAEHKADRATVVREALLTAGIVAPDVERMATNVTLADGLPRFIWTDSRPDPATYSRVLLASIAERQRWREQYEQAKTMAGTVDKSFGNPGRPP